MTMEIPPGFLRILTASHDFRRASAAAAFELWQMPTAAPWDEQWNHRFPVGFCHEIYWLVGGLEHFLVSHILGIIIPLD